MLTRRWKVKIALIVAGLAVIAAEAWCLPSLGLWFAKRKAWEEIEAIAARSRQALYCTPAPGLRELPARSTTADLLQRSVDEYTLSLPADTYRLDMTDPNLLVGPKVTVCFRGVGTRTPKFRREFAPPSAAVQGYFDRTDPYQLLTDAFAATPEGINAAADHDQLQKHLYLMLLRSAVQPGGAERQWLQFRSSGRKGFLAGDLTSKPMDASLYIDEAGLFASVALSPAPDATMEDIWSCLSQLTVQKQPDPQRP